MRRNRNNRYAGTTTLADWSDIISMSAQGLGPSEIGRTIGVTRQAAHQSVRLARSGITMVATAACARAGLLGVSLCDSASVSNVRKK
jgi:hypothetical protein